MKYLPTFLFLIMISFFGCKSGSNEEPNLTVCDHVSDVVENMPELIGGMAGLQERKVYPEVAIRAEIEGRVTVEFVVNKEGNTENVKVIRGIGGGCDEEAIRLIKTAEFRPAMQNGKPACVRMSLPVLFKLPN